jgi:hypothetical protein
MLNIKGIQGGVEVLREIDCMPAMYTDERELPGETETNNALEEYMHNQQEVPRTTFRFAIPIPPVDMAKGIVKLSRQ